MEKKQPVQSDSKSFALIKELLTPGVFEKKEFLWKEISAALAEITETPTPQAEGLLVGLLELEAPIRLAPESDFPSAMSPEDILKSIAIETLSEWTGRKYLKAFEAVEARTESPMLSETAKVQIEKWRVPTYEPVIMEPAIEEDQPVPSNSKSFALIKELLTPGVFEKKEFLWKEISAALAEITETPTPQAEGLLVGLLELEAPIRLAPESDFPSAMSPEDILKSIAIETLSEWTGRKYLKAFEALRDRSESPMVSALARSHIERLGREPRE